MIKKWWMETGAWMVPCWGGGIQYDWSASTGSVRDYCATCTTGRGMESSASLAGGRLILTTRSGNG